MSRETRYVGQVQWPEGFDSSFTFDWSTQKGGRGLTNTAQYQAVENTWPPPKPAWSAFLGQEEENKGEFFLMIFLR